MSKKKKASDMFNDSELFLGKKVSFAEAFPQISELKIEVNEYKDFWKKDDGYYPISHVFNESDMPQYVDCSEPSCKGGGFSLGNIVHTMVHDKNLFLEDSTNCIGKIGSQRCVHTFDYKISINYK